MDTVHEAYTWDGESLMLDAWCLVLGAGCLVLGSGYGELKLAGTILKFSNLIEAR